MLTSIGVVLVPTLRRSSALTGVGTDDMDRTVAPKSPKSKFNGGDLPARSRGTAVSHLRSVHPRKIGLR
jgi:hypothetical protein